MLQRGERQETEVLPKAKRRTFTAKHKREIVRDVFGAVGGTARGTMWTSRRHPCFPSGTIIPRSRSDGHAQCFQSALRGMYVVGSNGRVFGPIEDLVVDDASLQVTAVIVLGSLLVLRTSLDEFAQLLAQADAS
jgi:hypothetical protein